MKLTWKNGASLLLQFDNLTVLVNPTEYGEEAPDAVIVTAYSDNCFSRDALTRYADAGARLLLCKEAYDELSSCDTAVLLAPHSVWSERGVTFYAVKAETASRTAIGIIADDADKTYYVSGPTLYNFDVIDDCLDLAPDGVDLAILPISGRRCTMNARDAADFAYEIGAKCAVPVDYLTPDTAALFDFDDAVIIERGEAREF